ncbi:MAG: hypothetical protein R6U98_17305, partial [Pirellulaceae bacterium]
FRSITGNRFPESFKTFGSLADKSLIGGGSGSDALGLHLIDGQTAGTGFDRLNFLQGLALRFPLLLLRFGSRTRALD